MELKDLRENIRKSGDDDRFREIINAIVSQNFDDPKFQNLHEDYSALDAIFFHDKTNESAVNDNDYKKFINKVLLKDFCKHYDIDFSELSLEEKRNREKATLINFARSINTSKGLVFDSSNFYGESYELNENIGLILNVSGENTFKVLNDVYQVLKSNKVVCSLQTRFTSELTKGYVSNIAIGVSQKFLNKAIDALEKLSPETISLIKRPSLLYANANSYTGYDYSYLVEGNTSQSEKVKEIIEKSIHDTVEEIINKRSEVAQKALNDELKQERATGDNLLLTDLKIINRAVRFDPSIKGVLTKYMTRNNRDINRCDYLFNNVRQEYFFNQMGVETDFEIYPYEDPALTAGEAIRKVFKHQEPSPVDEVDEIQEENTSIELSQDDLNNISELAATPTEDENSELANSLVEAEELNVPAPQIEFVQEEVQEEKDEDTEKKEDLQNLETTQALNIINDETIVTSTSATLVNAPDVESVQGYTMEIINPMPDQVVLDDTSTYTSENNDQGTGGNGPTIIEVEDYVTPQIPITIKEDPTIPIQEEKPTEEQSDYQNQEVVSPSIYEEPSVSETLIEESDTKQTPAITEDEINEIVGILDGTIRVDKNTSEQEAQMDTIFKEISSAAPKIEKALTNLSAKDDNLTDDEVNNLIAATSDNELTNPNSQKYERILEDISALEKSVPGTNFTLLDYFENAQILEQIDVNQSYKIMSDEIISGKDLINNISQYVISNGSVPLNVILDEYGAEPIGIKSAKEKGGLLRIFGKKS